MKPAPFSRSIAGVSSQTPTGRPVRPRRARRDGVDDPLGDDVARRQLVDEALALGVVEGRAVAAGGLRQRVPRQRLGPDRAGRWRCQSRPPAPRRPAPAPCAAPRGRVGVVGAADSEGVGLPASRRRRRRARRPRPRVVRAPLPLGASVATQSSPRAQLERAGRLPHLGAARAHRRRSALTISAPVRSPACSSRLRVARRSAAAQRPSSRLKPTPSDSSQAIASGPLRQGAARAAAAPRDGRRRRCPRSATRWSRRRRSPPGCRPGRARCCRPRGPTS